MSAKLVERVRLNGGRAGCHDRFCSRRPVGGEVFYLDSPFIERPLIGHQQLKGENGLTTLRFAAVGLQTRVKARGPGL